MPSLRDKLLQRYWRFSRAVTLGVRGLIVAPDQRVLLIRHGYTPGWHFPGGGVEFNEVLETALEREVREETGVVIEAPPRLHGIFGNFEAFPGDHVALFIIERWSQPTVPAPNHEIAEQGLFPLDALPDSLTRGSRRRLDEVFGGAPRSQRW